MPNFGQKPQQNKSAPQPVGGFLDQLASIGGTIRKQAVEDLAKGTFDEVLREFGVGSTQKQEQVLFDGQEARKKAEKAAQEAKNRQKIVSLQQELARMANEEQNLRSELTEISQTVVNIAKSVDSQIPVGIEKIPAKPGVYHKVFYVRILEEFRKKADEARDWRTTQQVRVTSKPARGSLLWVGDQKKVHEAGAMFLLQG